MQVPTVELTRAYLIYVPPHHEQYFRPFEMNLTPGLVNSVLEYTDEGRYVSSNNLSDIAGHILRPAATPQNKIAIPNGLGEGRFIFFLEITTNNCFGNTREIISGFTDYMGISASGHLDPNMVFYINSRKSLQDSIVTGAAGRGIKTALRDDSQLLTNQGYMSSIAMRPQDVVAAGQTSLLTGGYNSNVIDTRNDLNSSPLLSQRGNTLPNHYLSNTLNGYIKAANATSIIGGDVTPDELYSEAMGYVRSPRMAVSDFVSAMGLSSVDGVDKFTFGQLDATWPRPDGWWNVTRPSPGSRMERVRCSILENSEHWHGANIETSIAFSLSQAMPAIMSSLMLVYLDVTIEPTPITGQPVVVVLKTIGMFDGVVTPAHIQLLETQLSYDVVNSIIGKNVTDFKIAMSVNLMESGTYNISVNGFPSSVFVAPTFCDSFASPVVGMDKSSLTNMNKNMETLVDTLITSRAESMGLMAPTYYDRDNSFGEQGAGDYDVRHEPYYQPQQQNFYQPQHNSGDFIMPPERNNDTNNAPTINTPPRRAIP